MKFKYGYVLYLIYLLPYPNALIEFVFQILHNQ